MPDPSSSVREDGGSHGVPRIIAAGLALAAAACMITACGSTSAAAGTAVKGVAVLKNYSPPDNGCASFSAQLPKDPQGLLASLDATHRDAYEGYSAFDPGAVKVLPSTWANWKPHHGPPYTVGISWSALVSDFQVQTVNLLKSELMKAGFRVVLRTTSQIDIGQQLTQFHSLVLDNPDFIILEAPTPDAFAGVINQAAGRGIPTLSFSGYVDSPNVINLDTNFYLAHAQMTSALAGVLGGKGNILYLHGVSGVTADADAQAAWDQILKHCPGLQKAGDVYGGFSDSLAKGQLLTYLATHPQPINGVVATAGMTVGATEAFMQTGRPVPVITDFGPTSGRLGYWNDHKTFPYVAAAFPPAAAAGGMVDVAQRVLGGQGLKMNLLVDRSPLITNFNAGAWAEPSWTLSTPGVPTGTRDAEFSDSYLAAFFARPAPEHQ
jgi:ribose transport system substrate-binding protein